MSAAIVASVGNQPGLPQFRSWPWQALGVRCLAAAVARQRCGGAQGHTSDYQEAACWKSENLFFETDSSIEYRSSVSECRRLPLEGVLRPKPFPRGEAPSQVDFWSGLCGKTLPGARCRGWGPDDVVFRCCQDILANPT